MAPVPVLTSPAGMVMDADTGAVVWSTSPDSQLPQASTTKMTTLLLLYEYDPALNDTITVSSAASLTSGSSAEMPAGSTWSAREMAYGLMLPSGNDAAVAIAEHVGQVYLGAADATAGVAAFVARMNSRVAELGCTNTQYKNPHGMQASGHYSSARDLCLIAKHVFGIAELAEISGTVSRAGTALSGVSTPPNWENTGNLSGIYQTTASKQGWTPTANQCLAVLYETGGRRWVSSIIGGADTATRTDEQIAMLEYARDLAGVAGTKTGVSIPQHGRNRGTWEPSGYFDNLYLHGYGWYTDAPDDAFTYLFWGTSLTVLGPKSGSRGIMAVSLDGGAAVDVDLYAASVQKGATLYTVTGLADGAHTVTFTRTGRKNAAASGTQVSLDEFHVTRVIAAGAVEPPASEIVYHVEERAGTSGTFTAAPGGTGLTDTQFQRVLSALAEGTRQFRVQAEDLSDGAVSAWSTTRSITVDHPAEEPPPPPPPAGTFLAIDGEIYRVLALDPAHEPEAVAAVTVERAFDGTLLTGTVGAAGTAVARGAWRAVVYCTGAEADTLRAALALRQRVVVGGDYIGETATATGVLESATLDESWAGGTPTRTVQAVVRLEAI